MSHEVEKMAYVGQVPWHGLGTELEQGKSIEDWKKAAGLNYEVKESPQIFNNGQGLAVFEGNKVLFRGDNLRPLHTVGAGYKVVQPGEILEFFRDLVGVGGFTLETAGCLKGGRKVWALANINEAITVGKGDMVKGYLLLATSYDTSLCTIPKYTTVRVVCNNTLQASLAGGKDDLKIPHNLVFDPAKVKEYLGLAHDTMKEFGQTAKELSKRKVKDREALEWLVSVFGDPEKEIEEQEDAKIIKEVYTLYKGAGRGSNLITSQDTAWGLVNAATQFLDHNRNTRTADSRLDRAWFGDGARMKQKAWDEALVLARK